MSSYVEIIEKKIEEIPYNQLIIASEFYREFYMQISELTYAKCLERLSKIGRIVHLTKGVYYRPKETRFGIIPISEEEIAKYYLKDKQGVLVGYRLYNQKGITTQVSKQIEILSTKLREEQKHICNVYIRKINVELTTETISVIEALEILQAYNSIEDINIRYLIEYMHKFVNEYSNTAMEEVLEKQKYKKSTIAFMAAFLNHNHIENNLKKYLSPMSNYKIPNVEELYEIA